MKVVGAAARSGVFGKSFERLVAEGERALELSRQHHTLGHAEPVPGCPVCYNCEIVEARLVAGEPVVQFEHEGPLSPCSLVAVPRRGGGRR